MATQPKRRQPCFDPNRGSKPPEMIDLVDAAWIVKALAAVFALALVCAYVTLCILYSRTQWQLVLHPSRTFTATPASLSLPFSEVHFGVDASGQPQLDGWFVPSDNSSDPTVLLLHSGDGSIADALPQAQTLHKVHLNVLLFDYRGYGRSGGQHPTEATMEADAESALTYLVTTRTISMASILAYGNGVGAPLAVKLCVDHPQIGALILEAPLGDFKTQVEHDPRSRLVPVALLFDQNFPLALPLHTLATPKLLLFYSAAVAAHPPAIFQYAADPKMTVELPTSRTPSILESLTRFVTAYVARPPSTLIPTPNP
jgi:uncharacterized protein